MWRHCVVGLAFHLAQEAECMSILLLWWSWGYLQQSGPRHLCLFLMCRTWKWACEALFLSKSYLLPSSYSNLLIFFPLLIQMNIRFTDAGPLHHHSFSVFTFHFSSAWIHSRGYILTQAVRLTVLSHCHSLCGRRVEEWDNKRNRI